MPPARYRCATCGNLTRFDVTVTGGTFGITTMKKPFEMQFTYAAYPYVMLAFILAMTVVLWLICSRLATSTYGATLRAARDNEPLAQAMGKSIRTLRLSTYATVGVLVGVFVAPAYAWFLGALVPSIFTSHLTFTVWAGLVIGGRSYTGTDGGAGDIGHVRVSPQSEARCQCGMHGCLAAVASGRADVYEPEHDVYWGTEEQWLADTRIQEEEGKALADDIFYGVIQRSGDIPSTYVEALAKYWKREWAGRSEEEVIREFTDDHIRAQLKHMTDEEAWTPFAHRVMLLMRRSRVPCRTSV